MPKRPDWKALAARLKDFYGERGRLPSFFELQRLWGYRSKSGVSHAISRLISQKILKKDANGRLVATPFLEGGLRLVGTVQAGFPSPAEEELSDVLSLDQFLVSNPEGSFIVKVSGDSMIDAGILPGDLVIVDRARRPKPGDIVVAQVDSEWTMKYYEMRGTKPILRAANKRYPPIEPATELVIGGVVVANVRKYR